MPWTICKAFSKYFYYLIVNKIEKKKKKASPIHEAGHFWKKRVTKGRPSNNKRDFPWNNSNILILFRSLGKIYKGIKCFPSYEFKVISE